MRQFGKNRYLQYSYILLSVIIAHIFLFPLFYVNNGFAASKNEAPITSSKESNNQTITITGKITNITKAKKYFTKNSHLVLCNSDKGFRTTIGLSGNFEVEDSSFPKTSISEKGIFSFNLESLEPGQYIIFLQPVSGFTTGKYSIAFVVDEKTSKRVEIKYPQDNGSSKKIDLKNVLLDTP
jgi:hypothetical protein